MKQHTFGQMLKAAAAAAGLTQAELAEKSGLTRVSVSSHMRGITQPSAAQMAIYADVLGVRWLIGAESVDLQWAPSDSNRQPTDREFAGAAA